MAEFLMLIDSLKCTENKKSKYRVAFAEKLKVIINNCNCCISFFCDVLMQIL